jgi:hypothetical protein
MSAVKDVFGDNLAFGCLFHYCKALLLHIRKKLPNLYHMYVDQKSAIRKWIRTLMALPLLRKTDLLRLWDGLKTPPNFHSTESLILKEVGNLVEYMDKEWLSKSDNAWNFNALSKVRTTNSAEAYHSALKRFLA